MTVRMDLTDHARGNRAAWQEKADWYATPGRRCWASNEVTWGIWGIPDAELPLFGDASRFAGLDTIELGCGTGYVSSWLARRGARSVGVDITPAQLDSARAFQAEFDVHFPLIEASAEQLPFDDASFDFAISEYGASLWCDPHLWIPEAARVLRPGGELVFLTNSPLLVMCTAYNAVASDPAGIELVRPQFGLGAVKFPDDPEATEFHTPHGEMIEILTRSGFAIADLIEVQAPADASSSYEFVTAEWARSWPSEEVWRVIKHSP